MNVLTSVTDGLTNQSRRTLTFLPLYDELLHTLLIVYSRIVCAPQFSCADRSDQDRTEFCCRQDNT